jgi:hypothetical protein
LLTLNATSDASAAVAFVIAPAAGVVAAHAEPFHAMT